MRPEEFEIQQETKPRTDEQKDDGTMVVLDALLSVDGDLALLTLGAAAIITGVDLMAIDHGQPMAVHRAEDLVADQALVHPSQDGAQPLDIEEFRNIGDLIAAGHGVA